MFCEKKVLLKISLNFLEKPVPQVLSFEFWQIFKNTYFAENLQTAASEMLK